MKVPRQYACIKEVYRLRMKNIAEGDWDTIQTYVNVAPFSAGYYVDHGAWKVSFKTDRVDLCSLLGAKKRPFKKACNFDVIAANKLAVELAMRLP